MRIVGICRFSLLGRGDRGAYRVKTDHEAAAITDQQARVLFQPDQMEARLKSFEHLTLASIRSQSDQDFTMIVLASDMMPGPYRDRLDKIRASVPQVVLRYFPVIAALDAQREVFSDMGLTFRQVVQFRLDDDDCVNIDYIRDLRRYAEAMRPASDRFRR